VSVRCRRNRLIVGTRTAMSGLFRDVFDEVFLCRDVFDEVGFLSEHVRCGRVSVGMSSAMSALCRDLFGEVGLVSGLDRRSRVSVSTCSACSA